MKQNVILILSVIAGIVAAFVTMKYFDAKDAEVGRASCRERVSSVV